MAQSVSQPKKASLAAELAPAPKAQTPPAPAPARAPPVARTPSTRRAHPEDYQSADTEDFEPPRLSHVRILPTSLPYVHDQLMEQRDREQRARQEAARADPSAPQQELSQEDQALSARALKPHSRSVVDLDKLRFEPPIGHPITQQPKRSRKWQFGIRSRNQPYEAMLYLYRAIAAQGGLWDIKPAESGMSSSCFA
jgi:carbon catabolite-derepressing protein kinase